MKPITASYRFVVEGRVQGVGFRQATRHRAMKLDVQGWVRNCANGSVEGYASGEDAALEVLRQWLQHGPSTAQVSRLIWTADFANEVEASGFRIER